MVHPLLILASYMFTSIFSTLAILTAFAAASDPTTPQRLRSKSYERDYNGLYLSNYHTGAGSADATLSPHFLSALPGAFLNATADIATEHYYLDFNVTIATETGEAFYSAQVQVTEEYDSMYKLTVNAAQEPTPGFSFDSAGRLAWEDSTDFAACNCTTQDVCPLSLIANCRGRISTF
jgi:hypothetical protein